MVRRLALVLALVSTGCDAPPRGEALIVVDTDMPIPKIVDHLRVDIYSADGSQWWVSRDIYEPDPSLWPLSFSVYTDDTNVGASVLVRLRAYQSGYVQDYRGEGQISLPALGTAWSTADGAKCCSADCTSLCPSYWQPSATCQASCPRLIEPSGADATPLTEPQPLVTIDRLVLLDLQPGIRGKLSVLLAGACAGTQAVLADPTRDNPSPSDIQTCVDTERALVPVEPATLDPDMTYTLGTSVQGRFEQPFAIDCSRPTKTATPKMFDDEICVRGGVMIFGDNRGYDPPPANSRPRIAAVPSFFLDKYELTAGRLRDAMAHGFQPPANSITFNDGPLNTGTTPFPSASDCTGYQSATWSTQQRDAKPLNCINNAAAHALCQREGGDLPTEVQWEYAATMAGRPRKGFVTYPTLDGPLPQCDDVVFARLNLALVVDADTCYVKHPTLYGINVVDFGSDIADPSDGGIIGMSGNVSELVLDTGVSMYANCWLSAPIASPACVLANPPATIARGSSLATAQTAVTTAQRGALSVTIRGADVGVRCAR